MYKLVSTQILSYYKIPAYAYSYRHLLKPVSQSAIESKYYFHREINENVELKLRKQDELKESFKIIYRAPIKNYIKFSYFTVFGSISTIIPFIGSALIINGFPFHEYPVMISGLPVVSSPLEMYGVVAALFLVAFQIGVVVFNYPLRIYKCSEENLYAAVFQHLLPWKHQKKLFKQGELQKNTKGVMPWKDSLYLMKNKKVILIESSFTRPSDLEEMMTLPKRPQKM